MGYGGGGKTSCAVRCVIDGKCICVAYMLVIGYGSINTCCIYVLLSNGLCGTLWMGPVVRLEGVTAILLLALRRFTSRSRTYFATL